MLLSSEDLNDLLDCPYRFKKFPSLTNENNKALFKVIEDTLSSGVLYKYRELLERIRKAAYILSKNFGLDQEETANTLKEAFKNIETISYKGLLSLPDKIVKVKTSGIGRHKDYIRYISFVEDYSERRSLDFDPLTLIQGAIITEKISIPDAAIQIFLKEKKVEWKLNPFNMYKYKIGKEFLEAVNLLLVKNIHPKNLMACKNCFFANSILKTCE